MSLKKILLTVCFPMVLMGCSTIPASGPYSSNINQSNQVKVKIATHNSENNSLKYMLAEIEPNLLNYLSEHGDEAASNYVWPENEVAKDITVNVGDTIQIAIFESQSGGLFIPIDSSVRPGNFVSLPPQTINSTGMITVPYAGEVQAAGKTTEEISKTIVDRLSDKAIEPQVVVSFNNRSGAEVSVIGNVNNAQRLSLGFNQYKILDAIASAGGPASPGYETKVSLQRDGEEYAIPFDELVMDSEKNIYSQINDTIYLYREPKTFTAYGAVSTQGNIPFGKRKLLLSEALGLTQGLLDTQANPAEIYIYRQKKYPYYTKADEAKVSDEVKPNKKEKPKSKLASAYTLSYERAGRPDPAFKILSKLGAEEKSKTASKPKEVIIDKKEEQIAEVEEDADVSVIFKLDMRKTNSFFLAQQFEMEDQDVVYVANAKSVEFLKFLNIVNPTSVTKINTRTAF